MSEADNLVATAGKAGTYEVWYLTLSDGRNGYWLRYTLHHLRGAPAAARLWFARFDKERPSADVALSVGYPSFEQEAGSFEIRIGEGLLRSGHARGRIEAAGHEVTWELDFPTGGPTLRLLPPAAERLAPTRPSVPNPDTVFSGTVTVDGETSEVREVPGQQGHLWGTRHADRWVWAHCNAFDEHDVAFEALVARSHRGPIRTPWTMFAALRWQGRWIHLRRVARNRDHVLGVWPIELESRAYRLTGRVVADPATMVRARYEDPRGEPRFCHNTEVGSSRLVLFERGRWGMEEVAVLTSTGTTHCEWAGRTPAPAEMPDFQTLD